MTTVVLNVKIDSELKEKLRQYAEENNENLGTATEKLLLLAFQVAESADEAGVSEERLFSRWWSRCPNSRTVVWPAHRRGSITINP